MYCEKCGNEITNEAKFCSGCGNVLIEQMENESTLNQNKEIQRLPFSKENPTLFKVLVLIVLIAGILLTIMGGSGSIFELIGFFFGSTSVIIGISFILGVIPATLLRNKIKNARIKIYGITTIIVTLLTIIGTITSN